MISFIHDVGYENCSRGLKVCTQNIFFFLNHWIILDHQHGQENIIEPIQSAVVSELNEDDPMLNDIVNREC